MSQRDLPEQAPENPGDVRLPELPDDQDSSDTVITIEPSPEQARSTQSRSTLRSRVHHEEKDKAKPVRRGPVKHVKEKLSDHEDDLGLGDDDQAVKAILKHVRDQSAISSAADRAAVDADVSAAAIKEIVTAAMAEVMANYNIVKPSDRYNSIKMIALAEARTIMDIHNREQANAHKNLSKQKHLVRPGGSSTAKWAAAGAVAKGALTTLTGVGVIVLAGYNVESFLQRADYAIPGPDPGTHFNATTNSTYEVPETADHATRDWAELAVVGVGAAAVIMGVKETLTALIDLTTSAAGALAAAEIDMAIEAGSAEQEPLNNTLAEVGRAQTSLMNTRSGLRTTNAAALEGLDGSGKSLITRKEALNLQAQLQILDARIAVLRGLHDKYAAARDAVIARYPKIGDHMV